MAPRRVVAADLEAIVSGALRAADAAIVVVAAIVSYGVRHGTYALPNLYIMTLSLLEEMWSRNLANLFVSPLRPFEFAIALMMLSMLRSLFGVVPAALLAIPLFAYSIFDLGLPLLAFWATLTIFAWGVGMTISKASS